MRKTDHNTYAEEKPCAIILGEPIYFCPDAGAPYDVQGSPLWCDVATGRISCNEEFLKWPSADREVGVAHELGHIYWAAKVGEAWRQHTPPDLRCASADFFAARWLGKARVLECLDRQLTGPSRSFRRRVLQRAP